MKTLLWVGDAACDSGFAECTHQTLDTLRYYYNVVVLGINYRGDPHDWPYPIYPALVPGGNPLGTNRMLELIAKHKPDIIVIQTDPWHIPRYLERLVPLKKKPVVVGAIAIDSLNCRGHEYLNGLDHAIFWTRFAEAEAVKGGYVKTSSVIPLGVDLGTFTPGDQRAARVEIKMPEKALDGFIVLNVNRNQPRKRLDLTFECFAEWFHSCKPENAWLYLHTCPTGEVGIDAMDLAGYYDLRGHVMLEQPDAYDALTKAQLAQTYRAADVMLSTSIAEGWGLPAMEGMACEIAQVLPKHSAYEEWARDGAILIPCPTTAMTSPGGVNTIGKVPHKADVVQALDHLYRRKTARQLLALQGRRLVERAEFRWADIGNRFVLELEKAYDGAQLLVAK